MRASFGRLTLWLAMGVSAWAPGALALAAQADDPVVLVEARFTSPTPDRPARLFVRASIRPGWHTYSVTQAPGGPVPTRITLEPSTEYRLAGDFQPDVPPDTKAEPAFRNLPVETHQGQVVWSAPLELASGAEPETLVLQGVLECQPCTADSCLPPQEHPFTATLADRDAGGTPRFPPGRTGADGASNVAWWVIITIALASGVILLAALVLIFPTSRGQKQT